MPKRDDIFVGGGDAFECDQCETLSDGKPMLNWVERDFCLCLNCLRNLAVSHLFPKARHKEQVIVRRRYVAEDTRKAIFQRDGYKCKQCSSIDNLQIDHIIPFSLGGATDPENLQTLCAKCNVAKRNQLIYEYEA